MTRFAAGAQALGLIVGLALAARATAADWPVVVASPQGRHEIKLRLERGALAYEVVRGGRTLIGPSAIHPEFSEPTIADDLRLLVVQRETGDREFALPWGKTARVVDRYAEARVRLKSTGATWTVELRAYDDGVAFRYGVEQDAARGDAEDSQTKPLELRNEATEFALQGSPQVMFDVLGGFTTSHEALYQYLPLADVPAKHLMDCPLLAVWPDGSAAAITEARVRDFAGMYLVRADDAATTLRTRLSPLPDRGDAAFTTESTSLTSPWRVVLLADAAGKLLESNLLLSLNDPPRGDFAWFTPGKTTFPWWNGDFEADHKRSDGGAVFLARNKQYVDFCAAHGIAYHAVHGDGRPWHQQTGGDYGNPTADADVRRPRAEIHLPEIVDYARARGVGVRLWVHWRPLSEHLDEAFALYEQWGIKGLMVDFLDRDDQRMNEFAERLLASAARHELHIQFHGSPKFSGEQRTFPHLVNREGVLNLEYLKWNDRCSPDHDVRVAYTRALAGPVDYHLGGFHAAAADQFKPQEIHPTVLGTRCHQLAMYVVFENPVPMVADSPERYEGEPGFDFLCELPTTWDETRFVAGEPGEYVVLARRKGATWYLGGINNSTPRTVTAPLAALREREAAGDGRSLRVRLYCDGPADGSQPNAVEITQKKLGEEPLEIRFAGGGGFVAKIEEE